MGGIAAQYAKRMKNYKRNSIQHVFFLGTPFQNRPYPFDPKMYEIYKAIRSYSDSRENITTYVSISGGYKDIMVPSASSIYPRIIQDLSTSTSESLSEALDSATYEEKKQASDWSNGLGMSILTTSIPGVNTTTDHYGLLWCHQLLRLVARSINGVLVRDLATSKVRLISLGIVRLNISKNTLLGENASFEDITNSVKRMEFGYTDDIERGAYHLVLPDWIWRIFRLYFAELWTLTSALIVCIFSWQIQTWQLSQHQTLSTSYYQSLQLRAGSFPPLTFYLDPFQLLPFLLPGFIITSSTSGIPSVSQCRRRVNIRMVFILLALVVLSLVVWSAFSPSGFIPSTNLDFEQLSMRFLIICVSYVHVVGTLYASAIATKWICRYALAPIYSCWIKELRKLRLQPVTWILGIYSGVCMWVVFTSGGFNLNQLLAAIILVTFMAVVISVVSLASGVQTARPVTEDHLNYRQSLSLILVLSCLSWAGTIVYAWYVLLKPAIIWNGSFAWKSVHILTMLWIILYLIFVAHDHMLPRPPSASFPMSSDQDLDMRSKNSHRYSMRNDSMTGKPGTGISVEECPHCVYEDGGDGAIYVECEVSETGNLHANRKTSREYWLGPTFKVVACDCFFRYKNEPNRYCGFCRRVCHVCGGGSGNRDEALRLERYLSEHRLQSAVQWMIPYCFQFGAVMQIFYIPQAMSAHWLYHLAMYVSILLLAYHKLSVQDPKREPWSWSESKKKK
uniref:GPI inositoldeacylase putative n=1 Tax=Albugo laibachii Nc14 TaxID=890382 RepID=F0WZG9_9STRA|nr:GPI inositoldeacylase putative [Albugo laibachii Nc14]|eukprot:CCA26889.1 GPI inositoldeacylase putative [Albugo laibachii Nc14]